MESSKPNGGSSLPPYWEVPGRLVVQTPKTPVNFEAPRREPPGTPVSNFTLAQSVLSPVGLRSTARRANGQEVVMESEDVDEILDASSTSTSAQPVSQEELLRSMFQSQRSINSDVLRRKKRIFERIEEDDDDGLKDTVMAAVWANGKLGAAYYELETSEMFVLPDTSESAPDYMVLRSLFQQVLPRYFVVSSRQDERMLKVVSELTGEKMTHDENGSPPVENPNDNDKTDQPHGLLYTVQGKDFGLDPCKQRMLGLKLPFEPKDNAPDEHTLFISSLLPFRSEIMIRAAGGLLSFLDKSAIEIFKIDLVEGQVPVLNIKVCSMDDLVLVDDSAWKSLQIFSVDIHPSAVKQANNSGSKEGLSVFSMLNRCSTVQGARALRMMLLRPSRKIATLNRRYDVIEFCCSTRNMEFVKAATNCLKSIKSLPKLLYKLSLLHASVGEWKDLYQTIYHALLLAEICSCQAHEIELFQEICSSQNMKALKQLSQEMMRVIDFVESQSAGRIVAKEGIDPLLDLKKQQYSVLPDIMGLVAQEEMLDLPGYVQQSCIVYLPEVGYLLQVSLWREDLTPDEIEIEGLEFKFKTMESAYYRSSRTKELDSVLGDCIVLILEKETSIMIFLTESIIQKSNLLLHIGCLISELDCLISMSTIAKNNGFVRPRIVSGDDKLKIVNGRHPLVEMIGDFVPNTTSFDSNERIVILTGPNASGKSIYLKQIGAIVIMALSGSFVPACRAYIPTYDRICTRIHATESLSTGFSTFMVDLSQMSMALRMTTNQSLVIIDEFGKGTAEADGVALLVASVEDFSERGRNSPTVFLSTHFYSLRRYLNITAVIKMQCMKFIEQNDGPVKEISYLYELKDGMCGSSFAHLVAESVGIPKHLIERSRLVEKVVTNESSEECLGLNKTPARLEREAVMIRISKEFLSMDLDEIDPKAYLASIKDLMNGLNHPADSPH